MTRFTVNLSDGLNERVKKYAEEMGITRASAINVLLTTALNQMEVSIKANELIKSQKDELQKVIGKMVQAIEGATGE